jgi:hypothetical protein
VTDYEDLALYMEAAEIVALTHGLIFEIGRVNALIHPLAQEDLAFWGMTYHEVKGGKWTHVPREEALRRLEPSAMDRALGVRPRG